MHNITNKISYEIESGDYPQKVKDAFAEKVLYIDELISQGKHHEARAVLKDILSSVDEEKVKKVLSLLNPEKTKDTYVEYESKQIYDNIEMLISKIVDDISQNNNIKKAYYKVSGKFSYQMLKMVSEQIFLSTNKLVFVVSDNDEVSGLVMETTQSQSKKPIPLVEAQEDEAGNLVLSFFSTKRGSVQDMNKDNIITKAYFQYLLETEDNRHILLLSEDKLESDYYTIKGTLLSIRDTGGIFQSIREVMLVHTAIPISMDLPNEEIEALAGTYTKEDIARSMLGSYASAFTDELKTLIMAQALTYRQFNYPIHLLIIGEAGTFKSRIPMNLLRFYNEPKGLISATNSTVRGLIAKFGGGKGVGEPGELAKYIRFAGIDEFTDMIKASKIGDNNMLSKLTSILDHERTVLTTGIGDLEVQIKCRVLAVGNPRLKDYTFSDLIDDLTPQLASRFIIYMMDEEDVLLARKNKVKIITLGNKAYTQGNPQIMSLMTTLAKKEVEIPESLYEKIEEYFQSIAELMKTELERQYWEARGYTHLVNLAAAISKLRYIVGEKADYKKMDAKDMDEAARILHSVMSKNVKEVNLIKYPIWKRRMLIRGLHKEIYEWVESKQYEGVPIEVVKSKYGQEGISVAKELYLYDLIAIIQQEGKYILLDKRYAEKVAGTVLQNLSQMEMLTIFGGG